MTKQELVGKVADGAEITKAQAGKAIDEFTKAVVQTLKKEGKLTLTGFGTFAVVKRKARTGRNPATGAAIKIKAGKSVRFRPGKGMKDQIK